jgi:hypothetical protein
VSTTDRAIVRLFSWGAGPVGQLAESIAFMYRKKKATVAAGMLLAKASSLPITQGESHDWPED